MPYNKTIIDFHGGKYRDIDPIFIMILQYHEYGVNIYTKPCIHFHESQ